MNDDKWFIKHQIVECKRRVKIFSKLHLTFILCFGGTTSLIYIKTIFMYIFSSSHYFPKLLNKHLFAHPSFSPPPHKKWKNFFVFFFSEFSFESLLLCVVLFLEIIMRVISPLNNRSQMVIIHTGWSFRLHS